MTITLNTPETSFQLDLTSAIRPRDPPASSPIDLFYAQRTVAIRLAAGVDIGGDDELRSLGLIPVFSAAEMYFRRVLAKAIGSCPICAEQAATQQIALGSISAFDKQERAFAIAEHQGFTSEGEIAKRTQKMLGIDLSRSDSVKAAVQEFEQLCHLRHCIVHSAGELMYLNRRQLGVRASGRIVVSLPQRDFQGVVSKVSNVVRAYNTYVGREIIFRWFKLGVGGEGWGRDKARFIRLVDVFWSNDDMAVPNYRQLYQDARAASGAA